MTNDGVIEGSNAPEVNPWDKALFADDINALHDPEQHPFIHAYEVGKLCAVLRGKGAEDPENHYLVVAELCNRVTRIQRHSNLEVQRSFFEGLKQGIDPTYTSPALVQ